MNMNVTPFHFDSIIKRGYSLDLLFILMLAKQDFDIATYCEDSAKMKALQQAAIRKGLLTENDKLTLEGINLIHYIEGEEIPLQPIKKTDDAFDKWWKAYPGTDTFVYKNIIFTGSRSLKAKKDDCKIKLNKILNEGEYTIDQIIAALNYEVIQKKENSVKTKTNKLTFMQNSLTYLNQRTFEPFIELIKEGVKLAIEPVMKGGTNI